MWSQPTNPFAEYRQMLDRRQLELATADAEPIIADLVAADRPVSWIEDELCRRLGQALAAQDASIAERRESGEAGVLDTYGPDRLLDAITEPTALAAVKTVTAVDEPNDRNGTWRLLLALARIVPHPNALIPVGVVEDLRESTISFPEDSIVAAPAAAPRWARDGYGTRFAITAPFAAADGTGRWYLWDIDVCNGEAYTVGAGYFPDADEAFAAWRSAVGPVAAGGARLEPVSDADLAARILPGSSFMFRPGGESEPQYAEFHRCRRLAQELRRSDHLAGGVSTDTVPSDRTFDPDAWIAEFTAWRAEHRPGRSALPEDFPADDEPLSEADVYSELAATWLSEEFPELAYTCSPHRIALTASAFRDLYDADFADVLLRLVPDVVAWLTERGGLSDAVADRARAFADSVALPDADLGGHARNLMAQIQE